MPTEYQYINKALQTRRSLLRRRRTKDPGTILMFESKIMAITEMIYVLNDNRTMFEE